jgi:outer membrane lipoprotein-sorting protein
MTLKVKKFIWLVAKNYILLKTTFWREDGLETLNATFVVHMK